jgi:hypothetical protein
VRQGFRRAYPGAVDFHGDLARGRVAGIWKERILGWPSGEERFRQKGGEGAGEHAGGICLHVTEVEGAAGDARLEKLENDAKSHGEQEGLDFVGAGAEAGDGEEGEGGIAGKVQELVVVRDIAAEVGGWGKG